MSLKTDLTSADLNEIRRSALGAADPLGVAAELADAVDAGRLADQADAGYALALAAEIAESRAKFDAALRYVDRAVEAYGTRDDSETGAARALRARILFQTGHDDEAMAELEPLRPLLTRYPDASAYLSSALDIGKRARLAEQWLTEAVQSTLAERDSAEPANAEDAGQLFFLLQQRHRIRHAIGLPHDNHDNLAERLETRLANATAAEAATEHELVFFPQAEFERLRAKWPAATAYGESFDEHRAHLETELVRLAGAGRVGLAVLPGALDGLTGDPAEAKTRAAYARQLAASSRRISWPPERNAACWCGSGNKYKKCCLPRSRG
ncbi:SEC-C domain-containing protein [Paractinoplanes durhamensis]|uniref:Preprotein translocase SecA n=1 Tax=Paractinoplanes durhamensis TaxID=113563 RepID=A0ABQ3Z5M0_9ACTN|nr:SEC-C domain-containing protein [Actinoplanes durhamensis]GIE05127.1 preprotein translocase SecA [Actinoplanes durhamensis]